MQQYAEAFRDNAIDAAVLPELTADDLKDPGVSDSRSITRTAAKSIWGSSWPRICCV